MFFLFREVSVLTDHVNPEFQVTEVRLMCWKIEVAWNCSAQDVFWISQTLA